MLHDWHQFHADDATMPAVVDPRRRLRICLVGFFVLLLVVFARTVQLEVSHGAAYRTAAIRPLKRERSLPGVRGRILGRDGTVLAGNREIPAVAVHYRYLQQPPDPAWLHATARRRLATPQRKDPERLEAEKARVCQERTELAGRVAELCETSIDRWHQRARRIQTRVERIADDVNRRRQDRAAESSSSPEPPPDSLFARVRRALGESFDTSAEEAAARITVAAELDYHVMAGDVPLSVVAEIEGHPQRYPGVKIVRYNRRVYPSGNLAAHVLGHLGRVGKEELQARDDEGAGYHPEDFVGRMGVERQYESLLYGRRGMAVELTDHSGRIIETERRREPGMGWDLVLTLHPPLQRAAETLLQEALQRRTIGPEEVEPAGGSIVVMDVHSGELWVAAAAPAFEPGVFVGGDTAERESLLVDPSHPLFDRTSKMALPPGSVLKTVAAVALLESAFADPDEPFFCQGYLSEPDRHRCAIFRRHGVGHDEVTLYDALAQSCNVYFFHHAGELGPEPLIDWALKFGLAQRTGVDLPGEAAGMVPTPATIRALEGHAWRPGDTYSLAIGQGSLTATPLQIARVMAAVANGGRLVTPHVQMRCQEPVSQRAPAGESDTGTRVPSTFSIPHPRPIPDLSHQTLATIREGLRRVVSDPAGTAHGAAHLETIAIAGKTGTAEVGGQRASHAWFAGYVPAEQPKFALVIVLEHSGDAAAAAAPVAKRLVLQMQRQGIL